MKAMCKMIKQGCNDIQRQMFLALLWKKCSLVFYWEMKEGWERLDYVIYCNKNEPSRLAWF